MAALAPAVAAPLVQVRPQARQPAPQACGGSADQTRQANESEEGKVTEDSEEICHNAEGGTYAGGRGGVQQPPGLPRQRLGEKARG